MAYFPRPESPAIKNLKWLNEISRHVRKTDVKVFVSVFCILRLLSAGVSCKDYSLPRLQRSSGDLSGVLNKVLGYAYAGVNSSLKDRICLGKYNVSIGFD